MSEEEPRRTIRRVRDEDLDLWQQKLLTESRRLSREEQAHVERVRREAAEAHGRAGRSSAGPHDSA